LVTSSILLSWNKENCRFMNFFSPKALAFAVRVLKFYLKRQCSVSLYGIFFGDLFDKLSEIKLPWHQIFFSSHFSRLEYNLILFFRNMQRQIFPPFGGTDGRKLDRKLIHSRFRPIRTFRCSDDQETIENTFYR
jgi:hypothetical protein